MNGRKIEHPLKQGLKHTLNIETKEAIDFRKIEHPLKQGLKRISGGKDSSIMLPKNRASTKTRIETGIRQ